MRVCVAVAAVTAVACASDGTQRGSGAAGTVSAAGSSGAAGVGGTGGGPGGASGGSPDLRDAAVNVGDAANCGEVQITPQVQVTPGNLLILFDRSLSMADAFGGTTRLEAAKTAVLDALAPFACGANDPGCVEKLTVGAIMFPSAGTFDICYVEDINTPEQLAWQSATQFIPAWTQYWATHALVLGTPINPAFARGVQALMDPSLSGNRAVLFLTDGAGTCQGQPVDAATQAATWAGQGIKTHVVSLDVGGGQAFNDAVAVAGGTGASVSPADATALSAKLQEIVQTTTEVASCDVPLNGGRLTDAARACATGTVKVGDTAIPCDQQDQSDGFYVSDPSTIVLVGSACDHLTQSGNLTAVFPCDVIVPD